MLEFLRTNSLDETNTLFVTCGHWDLFKMLPSQLKTSKLGSAPPVLSQWCNIKVALKNQTGKDIRGMPDMLKHFHLPLIGRHHSGIDDARNIAAIAQALLKTGYVFDVTPNENAGAPRREKPEPVAPTSAESVSTDRVIPGLPPSAGKAKKAAKPVQNPPKPKNQPRAPPPPPPNCGPLIDIGANLTHHPFNKETLPDILRNAKSAANVVHVMITGTSLKSSIEAIELCRHFNNLGKDGEFPRLSCTVGVHPHDATRALEDKDIMRRLEELITKNRDVVVAVGECGLDFDRNFSTPADQEVMFYNQARLSLKLGMPLFLHERSAHDKFMEIVKNVNSESTNGSKLFGVLHCYTGENED
ncbi:Metallo-dependent hydrolase, partial [Rhizoclosmatium globosum]